MGEKEKEFEALTAILITSTDHYVAKSCKGCCVSLLALNAGECMAECDEYVNDLTTLVTLT